MLNKGIGPRSATLQTQPWVFMSHLLILLSTLVLLFVKRITKSTIILALPDFHSRNAVRFTPRPPRKANSVRSNSVVCLSCIQNTVAWRVTGLAVTSCGTPKLPVPRFRPQVHSGCQPALLMSHLWRKDCIVCSCSRFRGAGISPHIFQLLN